MELFYLICHMLMFGGYSFYFPLFWLLDMSLLFVSLTCFQAVRLLEHQKQEVKRCQSTLLGNKSPVKLLSFPGWRKVSSYLIVPVSCYWFLGVIVWCFILFIGNSNGNNYDALISDVPIPLATKIYYSQRTNRLRSALGHLYHNVPNKECSSEFVHERELQANLVTTLTPSPNSFSPNQISDDRLDKVLMFF